MTGGWALFLSGRGSTAQALLGMTELFDIRLVVTSKKSANGVRHARRAGVAVHFHGLQSDWASLTRELRARGIDKIFLVGFMRILPAEFVQNWNGRIWNIHPSLLPRYPGLQAMQKSFHDGAPMGVSLHAVIPELDAGPLISQKAVERTDWEATELRMARLEQKLLRDALERLERRDLLLRARALSGRAA